jgi:hypothetical protein
MGFTRPLFSLLYSLLAGPHPRSLALRRSKTRYPRAGRRRFSLAAKRFGIGVPRAEVLQDDEGI